MRMRGWSRASVPATTMPSRFWSDDTRRRSSATCTAWSAIRSRRATWSQETFLRAYKSLGSLDDPVCCEAGCTGSRITRHARCCAGGAWSAGCRSWPRTTGPIPDRSAIEAAQVEEALARVPVDQRAPLLLHLVAGFSYAEIAALLQITEGSVRMRISRGRAAFRQVYGAEEEDDAS